jgi:predicted membrane-bound spermidine synthase
MDTKTVNNTGRTIVLGVLIGAATGLMAALLLNRRARAAESTSAITTSDGLKIGVLVFGLLRAIASLGDEERKR